MRSQYYILILCCGLFAERFIISLCAASILFCSCSNNASNNSQIIDIESAIGKGAIHNASEFLEDIRYIPLETTAASIIGDIRNIIIENEKIYVLTYNDIITIFDINGKYLNTLNRIGRGPEEYLNISDFAINSRGNIVMSSYEEVLEYDANLKLVGKITPGKNANTDAGLWDFTLLEDGLFASNIMYGDTDPKYVMQDLIIYDDDSLSVIRSYNSSRQMFIPEVKGFVMFLYDRYIYKNSLNIYKPGNDTIFNIDYKNDYLKTARYIMNYGKYRLSEQMYIDTYEDYPEGSKLISLLTLHETDNYLFVSLNLRALAHEPFERKTSTGSYKNTNAYAIYNKKNREFFLLNQPIPQTLGLKEDMAIGPPFWPKGVTKKQELITWHNAYELITLAEEGKIDRNLVVNLKEDGNPVIVIATPK